MEAEYKLAVEIAERVADRFGSRPILLGQVTDVELDAAEKALGTRLPGSYRIFLRYFGSCVLPNHGLFGLPRDRLWGDIVLMNDLDPWGRAQRLVKFMEDAESRSYYFDTARVDDQGECPVVVRDRAGREVEVAPTFLLFLASAGGEAARILTV